MQSGTRLGGYEIVSALGAGGMGEVYRARDAKLGRDVALKILPRAFTNDPDRVARFKREAQVLASLNHPNIAAIYGFEESDSTPFLVLELVDGETLAARLKARALPLDEAIAIARQIADALEAAHEKGIVHRDLKPLNIALTGHDQVKVLDFGLAKAFDTSSSPGDSLPDGVTHSPTLTFQGTMAGVIIGTAAYMSPEQAKGRAADKRSDVWAFGCVLFEMLTGTRAYQGEDVSDTLATVLKSQPDWNTLDGVPPPIRTLVQRCLEKDRRQRIGDIAVARYVLSEPHGTVASVQAPTPRVAPPRPRIALLAGALIATAAVAGAIGWQIRQPPPAVRPLTRFPITLTADQSLAPAALGRHVLALSPDGSRLAFLANNQLFLRTMDQLESGAIRGAEDSPFDVFFSPDGQWIGYYAAGHFKKIPIGGGAPTTICEAQAPWGASWTGDRILFGGGPRGIFEVSANGGVPRLLVTADAKTAEFLHGPQLLPDGDSVLFTVGSAAAAIDRWSGAHVAVQSIKTGARKILLRGGTDGRYMPTGHLVYGREGVLFANAFALDRLELVGGPTAVVEGVGMAAGGLTGAVQFTTSGTGSLAYFPAQAGAITTINWRDRKGSDTLLTAPPHPFETPRVSPDGSRIVVHASDQDNDLWILDTKTGTLTRLTFDKGPDNSPVWTRDGKRVIYTSNRDGVPNLYWKSADGTGQAEALLSKPPDSSGALVANSVTPDGKALVYSVGVPSDVMLLPLDADGSERKPQPLVSQPQFAERGADISPDGKWIAYYSDESGAFQVYVRPFPNVESGRWQVSSDGGMLPTWNRNGRELFYVDSRAHLLSVDVQAGASFAFGRPATVFDLSDTVSVLRNYDFGPDGIRAAVIKQSRTRSAPQFVVVQNWFEELKQRVPGGKQ